MNRRVLFVDDEPEVLAGIARNLRKDFEIHTETDPRKALGMLEAGRVRVKVEVIYWGANEYTRQPLSSL